VLAFGTIGFGVAYAKVDLGAHPGLPLHTVKADARQVSSRVIVIMRDQLSGQPATRAAIGKRIRVETSVDAPVIAKVRRSGGRIHQRYHALNGFAATVSDGERAALASDPAVKAVVPDQVVQLPTPPITPSGGSSGGGASPGRTSGTATCPSDPSHPLLEPEALQTTHTAFTDPSTPQAQNLVTGQGVKVAFFADGLDVNAPDFIRPDGTHVFIDYQDFSGDGTSAPTDGREAFGDPSSIAAQGRQVYDLASVVNPAHPLPPGCTITVRGVAPGAELIGMKVFGNSNSSFNSTILEGLDYALTNDHPDVISESFGGYPVPDTSEDLTRQFNEQAVAAGVTVVEGSGDAGVEASPASAASDPAVIDAGASTTFRNYAQATQYGSQFAPGGWLSDNISSIESGGFTQGGRVVDLVAPGEANWALCSPDTATYQGCADPFKGTNPSGLQSFGGTSESAPLIAGGAALIIQAYRETHGGQSPSPALVRELLTSTATDLGEPGVEEGAGEMNTLAAVKAAKSVADGNGSPTPVGQGLLVTPNQATVVGPAGSTPTDRTFKVTNVGSTSQEIHAHARAIATTVSDRTGSVDIDASSPTFIDGFGNSDPFQVVTFHVPRHTDRLVAFDAWSGPLARVGMTLIDPNGKFAAFTRPQGNGNHGEVDVSKPTGGGWEAIVFRSDGSFTGRVRFQFTTQDFGGVDSVSPATLTLAPGESAKLHLHTGLPSSAGDTEHDLVLSPSSGGPMIVPVVLRSLVDLGRHGGSFSGNLIGGNGRPSSPAQLDTFDFDVPAGEPELGVSLTFPDDAGTNISGTLVDPRGNAVAVESTTRIHENGGASSTHALQALHLDPRPGRWRFVVNVTNPVGGKALSVPYSGRVSFDAPRVSTTGLPDSADKIIKAGKTKTATIEVHNPGPASEDLFLDPRLPDRRPFSLLALTQDTALQFPLPAGSTPPIYLVPGQTNRLDAAAEATEPVTFDFGFGDPDIAAISEGTTASAHFAAPEVSPGLWKVGPSPVGPFTSPAPSGTVSTGLVARIKPLDPHAKPSTGDLWQTVIDTNAPGFNLLTVRPGASGTMSLKLKPRGPQGEVVRGTLYVDDFSLALDFGNELLAIPYKYRIG
jgi:Subtilase family/Peptidase inhibitor I9